MQVLEGHTEAVWDLCLLPRREVGQPGQRLMQDRLVSASADRTVKVWSKGRDQQWILQSSLGPFGDDVVQTCLSVYNMDFGKVLIGLSDGLVQLSDLEAGAGMISFGEASAGEYRLPLLVDRGRRSSQLHPESSDITDYHYRARIRPSPILRCNLPYVSIHLTP